jgi:hypothetical protein
MLKKKLVTVEVLGGLGNQLFGYVAGRSLARSLGCSVRIDLKMVGLGGTNHGSTIKSFNLNAIYFSKKKSKSPLSNLASRVNAKLVRDYAVVRFIAVKVFKIYQSQVIGYDPILKELKPGITIRGYFQTWRFVSELIANESFTLEVTDPSPWLEMMKQRSAAENPIMVHVRRGDYANLIDDFGLLSCEYYQNALDALSDPTKTEQVWIFSDDINLAKKLLSSVTDKELIWIDPPMESSAAESMMLMATARKLVIANSTFSWWAAMLGNRNKMVIAPAKWFKGRSDPEDLIPTGWITVESHWL